MLVFSRWAFPDVVGCLAVSAVYMMAGKILFVIEEYIKVLDKQKMAEDSKSSAIHGEVVE